MKFQVIDTETTGFEDAQVVELAVTCVYAEPTANAEMVTHRATTPAGEREETFYIGTTMSELSKPSKPIEIEAMAIHHITEDMVADATPWSETRTLVEYELSNTTALVAHNAEFDRQFFPVTTTLEGREVPWICTFRCAYELLRTAPRHTNQVLRYFLNLPVDPFRVLPAHRAGPDTYVTAHILAHLLTISSAEELIEISKHPRYLRKLGFGQHADVPIEDVPNSYLRWMRDQGEDGWDADKWYTLQREMERRNAAWKAARQA